MLHSDIVEDLTTELKESKKHQARIKRLRKKAGVVMKKPKKITVACTGPIAVSPKYESPWEDVWLSWKAKPGRKKYYLAPCLQGRIDAVQEHEINLECKEKYPEDDWDKEIENSKAVLEAMSLGKIYVADPESDMPAIYTPKDFIDRAEAEKMIVHLMGLHGVKNIKCVWKKPEFIIIPM
jgi:hypothetical protein